MISSRLKKKNFQTTKINLSKYSSQRQPFLQTLKETLSFHLLFHYLEVSCRLLSRYFCSYFSRQQVFKLNVTTHTHTGNNKNNFELTIEEECLLETWA